MPKPNLRGQAGKNIPHLQRFWLQTRKTRGCWVWTGNQDAYGYGRIVVNGVKVRAHRYSWELHHGKIPSKKMVCHTCDNPRCVRPDHLFIGSNADNRADSVRKNRHACGIRTGENNHKTKLTDAQIMEIRRRHKRRSYGPDGSGALAKEFGVTAEHIRNIIRNQTRRYGTGVVMFKGRRSTR